jgi:FMN phosphatase YigB (HAD superfamily)
MPYAYRDENGNILAVYEQAVDGCDEVAPDDPALKAFILKNVPGAGGDDWVQSDMQLARVLEDLIEVLIDKKLIMFSDFPAGAQKKLLERRGLRKEFSYVEDLFVGGEDFEDSEGNNSGGLF